MKINILRFSATTTKKTDGDFSLFPSFWNQLCRKVQTFREKKKKKEALCNYSTTNSEGSISL